VYGQDGYDLPWYSYVVTPDYAQVALSGESTYTYTTATTDPRAVEYPSGSGRMATVWVGNSFDIDVDLTDGQAHRVTLYALDWGGGPAASRSRSSTPRPGRCWTPARCRRSRAGCTCHGS
jgi:hypothetical protein